MIVSHFNGEKVYSVSEEAFSLNDKSSFGEKKERKIEYASVEVLYLVDEGRMEVLQGKKRLSFETLVKKFRRYDKKIDIKYHVFRDLRKKGYIVKTALKFGAEFRVYMKGVKPGEDHARWILFCVREQEMISWHDFSAKNRIAHSTKKNLLIGIVDEEGDVTYYEVRWERP